LPHLPLITHFHGTAAILRAGRNIVGIVSVVYIVNADSSIYSPGAANIIGVVHDAGVGGSDWYAGCLIDVSFGGNEWTAGCCILFLSLINAIDISSKITNNGSE
jgi:hypothetical protein